MSKSEASNMILNFLIKENRPYGVNDVLEKCGKDLGKSAVQKALDSLAEKGKIMSKTYGKSTIYHPKQKATLAEIKKDLQVSNQKLAQFQQNLKIRQGQLKGLEGKLKGLSSIPSIESLEEQREQLTKEICSLNEKLKRCEAGAALAKYTPDTAKKIEKDYEKVAVAYRKRKRICGDMLEAILEGYPKSKKSLIEDIGVETDEDAGFNIQVKH